MGKSDRKSHSRRNSQAEIDERPSWNNNDSTKRIVDKERFGSAGKAGEDSQSRGRGVNRDSNEMIKLTGMKSVLMARPDADYEAAARANEFVKRGKHNERSKRSN